MTNGVRAQFEQIFRWMAEKIEPIARARYPLELDEWQRELALIRRLIEQPDNVRIALVGTTGAGKSTFLNAVLGQEVLPVGVMQPCTAFVTLVRHAAGPAYELEVLFCSEEEWRRDVEAFAASLRIGEDDQLGDADNRRLVEAARKRIQAVYGNGLGEHPDADKVMALTLPPEAERVFRSGGIERRVFDSGDEMLGFLRRLIRGESILWPLVKQVSIAGPYSCLSGGLELVDLPGLNDPNEARVEVTREYLRTSPYVWVVFSMVRGLTQDIQAILKEEKLLQTLVLSGSFGALSLIGTKADDIDVNIAPQLDLAEDCSTDELIRAYRQQTVAQAREQLAVMVSDLARGTEHTDTLARMVQVARAVEVHATSASGYMKLAKIGRLRKDYGISRLEDTGLPGVHEHLARIAQIAGAEFNAKVAASKLDQLAQDIAFFFRAAATQTTPDVAEARLKIQEEAKVLARDVEQSQILASARLQAQREQFISNLQPMMQSATSEVARVCAAWHGIHWGTLRAIVQRHGVFRSPSTGRSYDFNEDLTEPLLSRLPVSWEKYFTDDLGRITDEFTLRIAEACKSFAQRARLIVSLVFRREDPGVEQQLTHFDARVRIMVQDAKSRIVAQVKERRGELARKIPLVAKAEMGSAFMRAKVETGRGMKNRILAILEERARACAPGIYSTIQADLLEGLNDLELLVVGMLNDLARAANEQARVIAHNANIGIREISMDPEIKGVLETCPITVTA